MTRIAVLSLALALATALSGCAINELQQGNAATEVRIRSGEENLLAEQQTQQSLIAKRNQLREDLARSEMNAAQLKAQLDQMSRVNDTAAVRTPRQRELRDQRAQQLSNASKEAQALDRDTTLSRQEKARQLQALKDKTRKMLDLLLQG